MSLKVAKLMTNSDRSAYYMLWFEKLLNLVTFSHFWLLLDTFVENLLAHNGVYEVTHLIKSVNSEKAMIWF